MMNMKIRRIVMWAFCLPATVLIAQDSVSWREYSDYILTHELVPAGPVPTAYDANGIYPYVSYVETSSRPVLRICLKTGF